MLLFIELFNFKVYLCYGAIAENKWYGFDVIYYEYGSLVLLYSNPDTAIRAYSILNKANFDDKQLLILLLPNIQVRSTSEAYRHTSPCRMVGGMFLWWHRTCGTI